MNRILRALALGAAAEMSLVSVIALAWKAQQAGGLNAAQLERSFPVNLVLLPLALVIAVAAIGRRTANRESLSIDHAHFLWTGLATVAASAAAFHGFLTHAFVTDASVDKDKVLRIAVLLLGVFLVVRGNFFAKLDPPAKAPPSITAAWTKGTLSIGWFAVAVGAAMIVAAFVVPGSALTASIAASGVALAAAECALRRTLAERR
jgi:hypothetical protein